MVAMSIFIFIGVATMGVLRTGLFTWRTGEAKRKTLESAQLVLSQIAQDIRNVFTHEPREGQSANIRLLCDYDSNGKQRIRFVRTVAGAISPYAQKKAGALVGGKSHLDLVNDYSEARMSALRATSGLCEVAYVMDSNPAYTKLFRGLRAPVGGTGTFFDDSNLMPGAANSTLIEFSDSVLYLGFHFWTQYTNTWAARHMPLVDPEPGEKSGPALWWDSTRSLSIFNAEDREFTTFVSGSSLGDPRDDIYPQAVQIVLVVAQGEIGAVTKLARSIDDLATRIPLDDASAFGKSGSNYVVIDSEWIRYKDVRRGELVLEDEYDRGARWSLPASHVRGAVVQEGKTFTLTLGLPGGREDWNAK
jgi:hypothetical protein